MSRWVVSGARDARHGLQRHGGHSPAATQPVENLKCSVISYIVSHFQVTDPTGFCRACVNTVVSGHLKPIPFLCLKLSVRS